LKLDGLAHSVSSVTDTDTFVISTDPTATTGPGLSGVVAESNPVGAAAKAPGINGDGVATFSGGTMHSGDTTGTGLVEPAWMIGEDFVAGMTLQFGNGIEMHAAGGAAVGDPTRSLMTIHPALTRVGANPNVPGTDLSDVTAVIDTSGAFFSDSTLQLPTTYDNWVDSRLHQFFWTMIWDPAGGSGTGWSTGSLGSSLCINMNNDVFVSDGGTSCTSDQANIRSVGGEFYFTHADGVVSSYWSGTESCQIGISFDEAATIVKTLDMPPVTDDFLPGKSWMWDVSSLMAPDELLTIEIGDGDSNIIASADCSGNFTLHFSLWGYPYDPF